LKFSLGKKSAIGDKPATKRNQEPISWNRLTFAAKPLITTDDMESHKTEVRLLKWFRPVTRLLLYSFAQFLNIWNEDGVSAEPEEDGLS
jgi:cohesin loading factor subunit SCC2